MKGRWQIQGWLSSALTSSSTYIWWTFSPVSECGLGEGKVGLILREIVCKVFLQRQTEAQLLLDKVYVVGRCIT
jgi:hypothetical protein